MASKPSAQATHPRVRRAGGDGKRSVLRRVWNVFTTVLVAIVVLFALLLVGVRLFGIQVYSIISGSMEPEYPVGSLIYVKPAEASEIASAT